MSKRLLHVVGSEVEIIRTRKFGKVEYVNEGSVESDTFYREVSYIINEVYYWYYEVRDPKAPSIPFVPTSEESFTDEEDKAWKALVEKINHNFPIRQKLAAILSMKITYNYNDTIEEQLE